jgi:hypothetical protein
MLLHRPVGAAGVDPRPPLRYPADTLSFRRPQRPAIALAALSVLTQHAAPALALATALVLAPAPALAQVDAYKQHMDNGIKLYQDNNYLAAIVEFQAAYQIKPKASPLVNIALCHKARFNYPKAIEALETALQKHSDTMDAADKQAAEGAVRDMRALLAYVEVKVSPPGATLVVDDEELPAGAAAKPVPLGPGTHRIGARAEGFAYAEQSVTLASGEKNAVKLSLVADKGWVTVQAPSPRMSIAIDQRAVGTGQWAGMVSPGPHLVQVYGPGGRPFTAQIFVTAGKPLNVRSNGSSGQVPILTAPPPPALPPPKKEPPPPPPTRRGYYGFVLGSLLWPVTHPPSFPPPDKRNFGAEYGLRLGYQVNTYAGFDFMYQHSSITTWGSKETKENYSASFYQVTSDRLAIGLRLLTSGKTLRLAGAIGGGPIFDGFTFFLKPSAVAECTIRSEKSPPCPLVDQDWDATSTKSSTFKTTAINAFLYVEGGIEIDLDHVLINLTWESQFQATGGIVNGAGIYDSQPLIRTGPALRVGYRFW